MVPDTPENKTPRPRFPSVSEHSDPGSPPPPPGEQDNEGTLPGLFLDNLKYHQLSASQRITLTNEHFDIPPKIEQNAREKDKNIIVDDDKERLISSFPVSTLITDAFANYVTSFEKESFKTLAGAANSAQASANASAVPASNKYDIKSGFQISPHIEKWEFKTYYRDIPQAVTFDGNISELKNAQQDPLPSSIKLSDQEWGNIQKAASYSLRALSHCDWFRSASVKVLDDSLSLLNPNIESESRCIDLLQAVKQMQIGIEYALEKLTKMAVYNHAGVTSILRKEFLQSVGTSIPVEQKCQMFGFPYGTSFVFQGKLHQVAPQVRDSRSDSMVSKSLDTALKIADTMAKNNPSSSSARSQSAPPYSPRKGRGGGGSNRGKQTRYPNQNFHQHFTRQNQFYQPHNPHQGSKSKPFFQPGSGRGGSGPRPQGPRNKGGPPNNNRGKGRKGN